MVSPTSLASSNAGDNNKSFFHLTGKVAGTFTAVGVVVVGLVAALLYCCCCGAGRRNDDYSDEENQYSSDEMSMANEKTAPVNDDAKNSSRANTTLTRDNSSKSIMSLFNAVPFASGGSNGTGGSGVGRSLSKKKLNPSKESLQGGDHPMFPILEFDHRLDPTTMFSTTNESKFSFADENDYSRRILHITNPE